MISPSQQQERAKKIASQYHDLPEANKDNLIQKVLTLITLPEFAPLFTCDALIEVPINGQLNGIGIAGQIDRLYVDETRIFLADFKTGQPVTGGVPPRYLQQIALYDGLLRKIYPGRDIECWLIWVDTLDYLVVDRKTRDTSLAEFFTSHTLAL